MNALLPYIPLDRRRALANGATLPSRTHGSALFVDISGFSRLTEQLVHVHGRRRGAEELTRHLNAVYTPLIAAIHAQGGSVIGFSGDAITCWFDAQSADTQTDSTQINSTQSDDAMRETANRAACAAWAIQATMPQFATIHAGDATVSLAVKTAIASGPARRFLVGDPDVQLIDVLAGATLDRMAQAEQLAHQGETIVDEATAFFLNVDSNFTQWHVNGADRFTKLENLSDLSSLKIKNSPFTIHHSLLEKWLLPPLRPRFLSGHTRFLAELRPAVALFLRFDGLDYDGDEQAGEQLDRYIRWVQAILTRYEGVLIQLTTGDKGSYLYATFGAPIAHGDDAQRAAASALALRTPPSDLAIASSQIGIAQGRMRVGAYGSETRRTYGVLGDATNLAARLMTQGAPGQVLLSPAVAEAINDSHRMEAAGEVTLKSGATILTYQLLAAQAEAARALISLYKEPLVGREAEVAQVETLLAQVREQGRGEILRVEGEAGVGKSHLAAEIAARARQRGYDVSIGACQSLSQQSPFIPVRQITRDLLGLPAASSGDGEDVQAQIKRVRQALARINSEWLLRLPLLGDLLGLPIPDNETTAAFDAQLRREALTALLIEMVQTRASRLSIDAAENAPAGRPLLLLIEDAHWMDEASQSIVLALARVVADAPLLLALVQRPPLHEDDAFYQEFTALDNQTHLALGELSAEGVAALVRQRLGGEIEPLALALIQTRAQGNAFFTEELVDALVESNSLVRRGMEFHAPTHELSPALIDRLRRADCLDRDGALRPDAVLASVDLGLPDSVHGLVLSRLDRLPEPVKLTLKVASVIGRVFELDLLRDAHPATVDSDALEGQLSTLAQRHFAQLETPAPQVAYIFKHNITQEAVYQTLLHSQQQTLHGRVARALETLQPEAVERLAHHFHSGNLARPAVRRQALHYLDAAAHHAQRDYANETALAQLDRALALEMRWGWLKTKIEVLHLLGRRDEERAVLEQLAQVEKVPPFELAFLWGEYHESISEFDEAREALQQALVSCRADGECGQEARALSRLGMIAWRQGDYAGAEEVYEEALRVIGKDESLRIEEADVRYGLGLVYRRQSRYLKAQPQFKQSLELYQHLNNRQQEATVLAALGASSYMQQQIDASIAYFEQALLLRRSIGDRVGEGSSLLNIAQVISEQGYYDRSETLLRQALAIQQALNNRWWESLVWNELSNVYKQTGRLQEALEAVRRGLLISNEVGDRSGDLYLLGNLGLIQRESNKLDEAEKTLEHALELATEQGDIQAEAALLSEWSVVSFFLNQLDNAYQHAFKALGLFETIQQKTLAAKCYAVLAMTYAAQNNKDNAIAYVEQALSCLRQSNSGDIEAPHHYYYYCYQVLRQFKQVNQANTTLIEAYSLLVQRVERIENVDIQHRYLNIALNQSIIDSYKSLGFSG